MQPAVLIIAHPGHELHLFGWMEAFRPMVCILSDGSGGAGTSRIDFSRRVLDACGAPRGPVMGVLPDRAWYAALLDGDPVPFLRAAELIAAAAAAGSTVIADPVEGYNPLHDLASALADQVVRKIGGHRLTFPLIRPATGHQPFRLSEGAILRKSAAIAGYTPLADEADVFLRQHPGCLATEMLREETWTWPAELNTEPEYERIGRSRVTNGRYGRTITYADHVLPMAVRLRAE